MDSLLANYASSDEEEEQDEPRQQNRTQPNPQTGNRNTSSSLSSLPKPQFSSPSSFSALFSALPPPKSCHASTPVPTSHDSISNPRKVVQFRPPIAPFISSKFNDKDDDEDEDSSRKKQEVVKRSTSAKSLIASMPAPRSSATLGAFPGSGRRAAVETTSLSSAENGVGVKSELNGEQGNQDSGGSNSNPFGAMEGQPGGGVTDVCDSSNWGRTDQSYMNYDSYGNYAGYAGHDYGNYYGQYDQTNWANESSTPYAPEASGVVENVAKASGKRGRDQIPTEIVEVNQDELMKNRPREDQVKLTGIAFGPSYQPVSSVGKPSKLHKRKHQIGSLYFDLKQKEMELSERRAKGMLTKAETQAKYGW